MQNSSLYLYDAGEHVTIVFTYWGTRQYHMTVNLKQIPTCRTKTNTSVTLSKQSEWVAPFNPSIVQPAKILYLR